MNGPYLVELSGLNNMTWHMPAQCFAQSRHSMKSFGGDLTRSSLNESSLGMSSGHFPVAFSPESAMEGPLLCARPWAPTMCCLDFWEEHRWQGDLGPGFGAAFSYYEDKYFLLL